MQKKTTELSTFIQQKVADLHYKTYENIARAHFKPKADVNLSFETLNQFCDKTAAFR